jgi:hypothetical protein
MKNWVLLGWDIAEATEESLVMQVEELRVRLRWTTNCEWPRRQLLAPATLTEVAHVD